MASKPPSFEQAMAKEMEALLKYGPQVAAMDYELAAQYQPQYQQMAVQLAEQERAAGQAQVAELAPGLQATRVAAEDPLTTQIRQQLLQGTSDELALGTQLTPEQNAQMNEQIRSAQFARGMGTGQSDASREALRKMLEGLSLQEQRRTRAQGVLGQEYAASPDPWATILGQPATQTAVSAQQSMASSPSNMLGTIGNTFQSQQAAQSDWQRYQATLELAKQNPNLY
jgi:hypothetical protein